MSEIVVVGGDGFLGWHLRVRLRAMANQSVDVIGRRELSDWIGLKRTLAVAHTVVHLAGVNRATSDSEVEEGNVRIAQRVCDAVLENGRPLHIVYSNSIQSGGDSPYGRGKRRAYEILSEAAERTRSTLMVVQLPNLFGEHGRPHYNSFVATFCHEIAAGRQPKVVEDRAVPLLHVQGAAEALIEAIRSRENGEMRPQGQKHKVSAILARLKQLDGLYVAGGGQIPELTDTFSVELFNTFRSYVFANFPMHIGVSSDARGELFECVRMHGGTGQVFVSTTVPGALRGDHYHLRKIERFFVLRGQAEIALRKVLDDNVVRFRVNGADRSLIDMPTMWTHSIRNIGEEDLVTLFWTNEMYDAADPDTYRELVESASGSTS